MANSSNKKTTPNKPVEELRLGTIKAAIWQNESKNGHRYSVRITRLYKDGEEWKTSDSFGRDELPLVAKVADLAHTWIFRANQRAEDDDE